MELTFDIIIDRTSAEVYVDDGAYSYVMQRHDRNAEGYQFWGTHPILVKSLEVSRMRSIWE